MRKHLQDTMEKRLLCLQYLAPCFFWLELVSASVDGGYHLWNERLNHLTSPRQGAAGLGMNVGITIFLGVAELAGALALIVGVLTQWAALGLILVMFGAIYMKVTKWKTGFWGEKSMGWHYHLLFVV
jgi:uncharacterized membrane protein YphA (DoxX/SURF4 family)